MLEHQAYAHGLQEAQQWRKQCEAAQREARSASSMADEKEKKLQVLGGRMVEQLQSMEAAR